MQEEAAGGEGGGEDLGELQPPCDDRFDVFVGKLAAELVFRDVWGRPGLNNHVRNMQ